MRKQLTLATSCVLAFCRKDIPEQRQRRNAITCSTAHQKLYRKLRKAERDKRVCMHCGKPSTPEERAEFRRWRGEVAQKNASPEKRVLSRLEGIRKHAFVVSDPSRKAKGRFSVRRRTR